MALVIFRGDIEFIMSWSVELEKLSTHNINIALDSQERLSIDRCTIS